MAPARLSTSMAIALGTAISRITGFLRVLALSYLFQTKGSADAPLADAYVLANTLPNIVYDLLIGGVLSATLLPFFTQHHERRDHEAVGAILGTSLAALAAIAAIATFGASLIVRMFTAFGVDDAVDATSYRHAATSLAYLLLPQIFFYGVTAILTALLNARRLFLAAAWAPVLNNVLVIGVLLLARQLLDAVPDLAELDRNGSFRWLLGLGTTAGVATMALALVPQAVGAGPRLHLRVDWRHPAVAQLLRLSGWTAGYVVANQVAFMIVTALAQRERGGVVAYQIMYQVFQLPYGLVAVTLMTTLSPEIASDAGRGDRSSFRRRVREGWWTLALLLTPASILLVAYAEPVSRAVGSLSNIESAPDVLAGFSVGLVAFSVYLFLMRGFYALRNTRTPFVINAFQNLLNVVFAVVLVGRFGVAGLAWSFSLAYAVAAVVAYLSLSSWARGLNARALAPRLLRYVAATAMAVVAAWAARDDVFASGWQLFASLAIIAALVGGVYVMMLIALGVVETDELLSFLPGRSSSQRTTKEPSQDRRDE